MSERRDPRSFLASALVLDGYSHDVAETIVRQALDAERHDAAEEIRNSAEGIITGLEKEFPYLDGDDTSKGIHGAADLIDREVQR